MADGANERQRVSRANGAGPRAPASERVGGHAGAKPPVQVLDSHQHFWRFDPRRDAWITDDMRAIRRDFLPADLEPVLAANHIDGCIAVQADQSEAETGFLLDLEVREFGDAIGRR